MAEQVARLKAAAERENGDEGGVLEEGRELGAGGRRSRNGGILGMGGVGYGAGGRADKRKRWSVCGAERRGDLDLETIWED